MLESPRQGRLELPESLRARMLAFRRRLWVIKLTEAGCGAVFGVLLAYLATFTLDRLWESPAAVRIGIFWAAVAGCALVPLALHRWLWRQRRLEQLAQLLSRTYPSIGDQLLGIIELVRSESEQARSRALCEAAILQVAEQAESRDFTKAIPHPKHRRRAALALAAAAVGVTLLALYPPAALNAWARFLMPWRDTPRYTFAMVDGLPDRKVVAHGEPFTLTVHLAEATVSRPAQAEARIGAQEPVGAALAEGRYDFELPPQIDAGWLEAKVGDFSGRVHVEPKPRPELNAIVAEVALPDYLQRKQPSKKDVRGGSISLVNGSRATFSATATRALSTARVSGQPVVPQGATVVSSPVLVAGNGQVQIQWEDEFGLQGKEPFVLSINGRDDEAPSIACEGLIPQKVVLDSEHLSFKLTARDDYGVKRVGMEWRGVDKANFKNPAAGERILTAGGPDKEQLELTGTFSAVALGIEPQPIQLRMFVEDYLPGRERVYSPRYLLYVLNAEQHAIWIAEQLSKWHRQSLEVRDREMQLFETNKQLRQLSAEEMDRPETRRRIEAQAEAERGNGRRLTNLVANGEDLIKQAMRNPEFGVGHLEKWAEMLQILKDISGNRMPSVADLLKQAAQAPSVDKNQSANSTRMAGQARASSPGRGPADSKPPAGKQGVPAISDTESSQQPPDSKGKPPAPREAKGSPKFSLPVTSLVGTGGKPGDANTANKKMDEAVAKQQDLLAEFDKVADELNRLLANLEGSTLVKRLKAASRLQNSIAGRLGDQVNKAFGARPAKVTGPERQLFNDLSSQEAKSSQNLSTIMDDMQAYFERRRFVQFKNVLDEMRQQDVVGGLRQLGDDLHKENGLSIAQCEFWSDTFDRWAEDLVDPACSGSCPGCKSRGSLPPSIVLEVLQVLEAEINLREDTRVAEQAKSALSKEQVSKQAVALSKTQKVLKVRIDKVVERIQDLPDGPSDFAKEIALLQAVSEVMVEAAGILARPETGSPAIAAETEVIELLLKSRRFNPGGGGGSGANPGGGGGGTTTDSALSLVGRGANEKEVRQDHGTAQATGDAGATLPEEFRAGLDAYFNRLEKIQP
jgi:hypothetical protein